MPLHLHDRFPRLVSHSLRFYDLKHDIRLVHLLPSSFSILPHIVIGISSRDKNFSFIPYGDLRHVYTNMYGLETGGRGFGVTSRRTRTTARQQPNGQKWVQVRQNTPKTAPVELLGGPVPVEREKVERTFTTYCRLSLGHPRKATAQKVDLLRQLFGFIQEVDGKAAIQPYLPKDSVNSICHPAHI